MKRIVKNMIYIVMCAFVFTACSDDDKADTAIPVITAFTPQEGDVTAQVTITGEHFGISRGAVDGHVYFNGIEAADYLDWSDTQIVATVPLGCVTGSIGVKCNGKTTLSAENFRFKSSNPEDSYEYGTYSKYLMCADVVEFTGSCNPCDYVDDTGKGSTLGQMGKDASYKGDSAAKSFSLWDSKPGDYTIFKLELEKPGKYYVSFKTATQISSSFVNVAVSSDLATLQDASTYNNKYSYDIEVSTWGTYLGPFEMGPYPIKEPGTYYIRFLMMNANMDEAAVATLSLIKVFN